MQPDALSFMTLMDIQAGCGRVSEAERTLRDMCQALAPGVHVAGMDVVPSVEGARLSESGEFLGGEGEGQRASVGLPLSTTPYGGKRVGVGNKRSKERRELEERRAWEKRRLAEDRKRAGEFVGFGALSGAESVMEAGGGGEKEGRFERGNRREGREEVVSVGLSEWERSIEEEANRRIAEMERKRKATEPSPRSLAQRVVGTRSKQAVRTPAHKGETPKEEEEKKGGNGPKEGAIGMAPLRGEEGPVGVGLSEGEEGERDARMVGFFTPGRGGAGEAAATVWGTSDATAAAADGNVRIFSVYSHARCFLVSC